MAPRTPGFLRDRRGAALFVWFTLYLAVFIGVFLTLWIDLPTLYYGRVATSKASRAALTGITHSCFDYAAWYASAGSGNPVMQLSAVCQGGYAQHQVRDGVLNIYAQGVPSGRFGTSPLQQGVCRDTTGLGPKQHCFETRWTLTLTTPGILGLLGTQQISEDTTVQLRLGAGP